MNVLALGTVGVFENIFQVIDRDIAFLFNTYTIPYFKNIYILNFSGTEIYFLISRYHHGASHKFSNKL